MKLVIFGSRNCYPTIAEIDYAVEIFGFTSVVMVVCGMADGADRSGKLWAEHHGLGVIPFPAEWDKYGKRAGFIRNKEMAKCADAGLGFWKGESGGTANMTAQLVLLRKRVVLV